MLWVPLNMGMSAAHCQGNVREFQSVWRVVSLLLQIVLVFISRHGKSPASAPVTITWTNMLLGFVRHLVVCCIVSER